MSYYDDLSVGSSEDHGSAESEDDNNYQDDRDWLLGCRRRGRTSDDDGKAKKYSTLENGLWDRCILHLDVDCFYCQCEEIDRNLRKETPMRPLAIGQKHIIVTSNYEARKYGVKKLQSRNDARRACPHLWIVEGSDLIQYRRHSRSVYEAFRAALKNIASDVEYPIQIPAKKGCMDEMVADLTAVVEGLLTQGKSLPRLANDPEQTRFVFGEDEPSSMAILVEDQTGEKSVVSFKPEGAKNDIDQQAALLASSRRNIHDNCGATEKDRSICRRRLDLAAEITARICYSIRNVTGFHTTGGISVSPLLAKLTSGLHKPKSVNVLYPWRSSQLLYSMPLRKMHKIGRGTAKAVEQQIAFEADIFEISRSTQHSSATQSSETKMLTVMNLLELPSSSLRQAIKGMTAYQSDISSDNQCELLIQQCRGIDTSEIEDDNGSLPQTVSVENSFRRGTLLTECSVKRAMEDLYQRLPLLLRDRASWAKDPKHSCPSTIRLTLRVVDPQSAIANKRRPYKTTSRQCPFDGRRFIVEEDSLEMQSIFIKNHIEPLLLKLLPPSIDITRINIALKGFQDTAMAQARLLGVGQVSLRTSLDHKLTPLENCSQPVSFSGTSKNGVFPSIQRSMVTVVQQYYCDSSPGEDVLKWEVC